MPLRGPGKPSARPGQGVGRGLAEVRESAINLKASHVGERSAQPAKMRSSTTTT